jgi:NADPH-dependent glutamate synthase beta subunit-like oxidoreductase/Pyruvate/2-oxoacid:ferredoxin oxidoreductase delta subunit
MGEQKDNKRITPTYRPEQAPKNAPCQAACLNCGDVRGWIGLVAQRRRTGTPRAEAFAQAWRNIVEVNPFPATLGRICPHPCESACNRADKDEPLAINALERFLGDHAISAGLDLPKLALPGSRKESLGVVGAGPSGLSFAYQMARRGYRVTVYDSNDRAGGMLRFGVPNYRLPHDILDVEIGRIHDLGVEFRLGTNIGADNSLEELQERHDYLYLGIGAQRGRNLELPGMDGPGVYIATDFLERINCGEKPDLGRHVVVVGGGNSAIDAARSARRLGAEVTIMYRRSLAQMPAVQDEIEEAMEEGIELMLQATPASLERTSEGQLAAINGVRMDLDDAGSSGRPRPVPRKDSEFSLQADTLVLAISQLPVLDGLDGTPVDKGWVVADSQGRVSEKLLAGGDAVGLGLAGNAIVQGRHAAEALFTRLTGEEPPAENASGVTAGPEEVRHEQKSNSEAVHATRLEPEERLKQFDAEVSETISEEQFLEEVERCFSCGACYGCEQCYMYCTAGCFTRVEEAGPGTYFSLDLDACRECGKCVEMCPCGYLEVVQP